MSSDIEHWDINAIVHKDCVEETQDQKSIWIEADEIELNLQKIRNSTVHLSQGLDKTMVLIDTMPCNPAANINKTTKEVRNLARVLAEVDPSTFDLLKC